MIIRRQEKRNVREAASCTMVDPYGKYRFRARPLREFSGGGGRGAIDDVACLRDARL